MLLKKLKDFLKENVYERLSVQMMALTFLCVLILASITTYMEVYNESEHFREVISQNIDFTQHTTEQILSDAIRDRDTDKLDGFLKLIANLPHVAYVSMTVYGQEPSSREKILEGEYHQGSKPDLSLKNAILKTYAINVDGRPAAEMEIITDPEFITTHISQKLVLILSLSLFTAVSLSAAILLLMHAMIIKHLRFLAEETKEFAIDQIDRPLILPNRKDDIFHNELDILVSSINKMRKTISREIKANEAKNSALKSQRDFSNTLLNSCNLMICRLDPDFRIISINAATTLLTGYLEVEVTGKNWIDIFVDPEKKDPVRQQLSESTYVTLKEMTMHDLEDNLLYLEWSFVPFYEGSFLKYRIAFGYDITKLKEAQQELMDLNNDLENKIASRTQTLKVTNEELMNAYQELKETQKQLIEAETMSSLGSLVSGIAHEINTPLGISVTAHTLIDEQVRNLTQMLKEGNTDPEDIQEIADVISESNAILSSNLKRASELIRSFKQVAVDSSSNVNYTFNIRENLNQTLLSLSNVVKKEHLFINVECPDKLELNSYPGALNQIYTNLIMNSAKHAWESGDTQRMIQISIRESEGNVIIRYSDNGSGISPAILDKIFEPFVTSKRGRGGSGLGANIIYNLTTKLLNGRIECRNLEPPEHGACFTITFPAVRDAGTKKESS